MKAAKILWKSFKVLAMIVAGLVIAAIAIFAYFAYDYKQNTRIPDPEWLLIDGRFQTPSGYEVMHGSWIFRSDASLSPDRAMMSGGDPNLRALTRDIETLLGAKPSIHWVYCARTRIADEWILGEGSVRGITQPQLQQFAKAYQRCVIERDAIAAGNPPNRYATRSIRYEISEHVKAKAGLSPISEQTRNCIRAHRDWDDFMVCMARHEPRMPAEVIQNDWEDVLKLVESLRKSVPGTLMDIMENAG